MLSPVLFLQTRYIIKSLNSKPIFYSLVNIFLHYAVSQFWLKKMVQTLQILSMFSLGGFFTCKRLYSVAVILTLCNCNQQKWAWHWNLKYSILNFFFFLQNSCFITPCCPHSTVLFYGFCKLVIVCSTSFHRISFQLYLVLFKHSFCF